MLVVICGHNIQTGNALRARKWPDSVRVVVKGFCENIDEYMAASDCLVTKAGPGTIAEAMIQGLPCVLSSFLPGQVWTLFKFCVKFVYFIMIYFYGIDRGDLWLNLNYSYNTIQCNMTQRNRNEFYLDRIL